jgi:hypothetical protein
MVNDLIKANPMIPHADDMILLGQNFVPGNEILLNFDKIN